MSRPIRAGLLALLLLVSLQVGALIPSPALADVGPADDRLLATPTSWWTYTGVTPSEVTSYLAVNNARLTDIQATSSSPKLTVTMVANSGDYASASWWYYGLTETQVNNKLAANSARPLSMSAYSTSNGVRYAVVMVSNTGTSQHASWWYQGSAKLINNKVSANGARLTDLSPYPGGGYVAIMVGNSGADTQSWWWYHGLTASQVTDDLAAHSARMIDLSRNHDGSFNVVMYGDTSTRWYWFYNLSPSAAVDKANQLGERILDTTSYSVNGKRRVAVVMTENLNALSQRLLGVMAPAVDSGSYGFYLKEVGGQTLAGLQQERRFEPAETLALLYHAKSIHEESIGNTTDAHVVTYHYSNLADPNDGSICPDDSATTTTTNLKNANLLMMQNSDHRMARAILEKYTKKLVARYGKSLGLTSTVINRNIGCSSTGSPNRSTLSDLGTSLESFQDGTVTSNLTWQAQFRSRMLNESNYAPEFQASICPVVNEEAAALGKSASVASEFCNAMTWIDAAGSYRYQSTFPKNVSLSEISLTGVPYKTAGTITPQYLVFGDDVDGATLNSKSESDALQSARTDLYQEALRDDIRSALETW
jgi:hypothetical protein